MFTLSLLLTAHLLNTRFIRAHGAARVGDKGRSGRNLRHYRSPLWNARGISYATSA